MNVRANQRCGTRALLWLCRVRPGGLFIALSLLFSLVATAEETRSVVELKSEVRKKGWIVFGARASAGDWDLFCCRPDGSDCRPLNVTAAYNEFSPQISRDGMKLLYRRIGRQEVIDNNRHGEQGELVLANADATAPEVLGKPGEIPWASFSPDGSKVASLSIKGISIIDLVSKEILRTIPRQGFFQQLTWSPNGEWLVGVANSYGTGWSIARMSVETGEATAVNRVDCCTPDWFPDSKNVIFSWRPSGQQENKGYGWTQLWRATADGGSRELVYGEDGRHVYGGQVSPDGQYVIFTGNMNEDGDPKNGGGPMGVMRLADAPVIGGKSVELRKLHPKAKNGPVLNLPPGWEPCWTAHDYALGPRETNAGGASPRPDNDPGKELALEVRGLGWIVYSAPSGRGDWDLYLMRPDGSEKQAITATADASEAGARFSSDGKKLLYYSLPRNEPMDNNTYGTFSLVIANADGSAAEIFGPGFQWASWGPGSTQIACLTPKAIQILDLASRKVIREFPRKGIVQQLLWSPDGSWFVGTANGLGQFWNIGVMNPSMGEWRAVSETERYNCTPDWCPDSRQVLYARGIIPEKPGRAELWVANVSGQERRRIYAEEGRHIYGACASPGPRATENKSVARPGYALFTRSVEDLGKVVGTEMAIIRWPEGEAANAEQVTRAPRLDLGPGWEPHWTYSDVKPGKR